MTSTGDAPPVAPARDTGQSGGSVLVKRDDPGERGRTTVADKVIEKIAARAALDAPHAGQLQHYVAGRAIGRSRIRVNADVDGRVASLKLELAVDFPISARDTTRAVRRNVTERVSTLCGLRVDHVDIVVAVLRRPDDKPRRVQ